MSTITKTAHIMKKYETIISRRDSTQPAIIGQNTAASTPMGQIYLFYICKYYAVTVLFLPKKHELNKHRKWSCCSLCCRDPDKTTIKHSIKYILSHFKENNKKFWMHETQNPQYHLPSSALHTGRYFIVSLSTSIPGDSLAKQPSNLIISP